MRVQRQVYSADEVFLAADNCNKCICHMDGRVDCQVEATILSKSAIIESVSSTARALRPRRGFSGGSSRIQETPHFQRRSWFFKVPGVEHRYTAPPVNVPRGRHRGCPFPSTASSKGAAQEAPMTLVAVACRLHLVRG
ncbi:hypothetical protein DPMN_124220 [Dreissena polymorpha]|uniref:Uncharacterized protein n=1 Tax=Dreissena polymorpha TaxID=45954 RepID=A0A9D4JW16_DREPO|nr:hypothetical protein DPMN_124220 [Dreissena polymorpha]